VIGQLQCLVLECPDPRAPARFHPALPGGWRHVRADPAGHPFCLVRA
jgi:hypothetical protein